MIQDGVSNPIVSCLSRGIFPAGQRDIGREEEAACLWTFLDFNEALYHDSLYPSLLPPQESLMNEQLKKICSITFLKSLCHHLEIK